MSRYFIEDAKCGYDTYDLCTCPKNREAELLNIGIGHYADEIDVPILDDEQWWLDNPEE